MAKTVQKRTLATRARLLEAAASVVGEKGYEALRVDEVVQRAGVAKGTFFAHFADKEALMDLLIGERIDRCLDDLELVAAPASVEDLVDSLLPLFRFMTCERYVFDVIMRHSGAATAKEIGEISGTYGRKGQIMERWLAEGPFRKDVPPRVLSEGVEAFAIQSMALQYCALHNSEPMGQRLLTYLRAWLLPKG